MEFRENDRRQHLRSRETARASSSRADSSLASAWERPGDQIVSRRHSGSASSVGVTSPTPAAASVSPAQELMNGSFINLYGDQELPASRHFDSVPVLLSRSVSNEPFRTSPVSTSQTTPTLTRNLSTEGRLRQKIARPYNPKPIASTPSLSASTLATNSVDTIKFPEDLKREVSVGSAAQPPNFIRRVTSGQSSNSSNSEGRRSLPETRLQATLSQQLRASFEAPLGVEETQAILDRLRQQKQRPSLTGATTHADSEPPFPKVQEVVTPIANNFSEDTKMSEDELLALEMSNATLNIPPASPPRGSLIKSIKSGSSSFRPKEPLAVPDVDFFPRKLRSESDEEHFFTNSFKTPEPKKEAVLTDNRAKPIYPTSNPAPFGPPDPLEALSDEELARRLAEGLIDEMPIQQSSSPPLDVAASDLPDAAEQLRIWQQIQEDQERKQLELALEESRRTVVGGSVDFVLASDPSTRYRHTGGEEMDILLSQQMALNEWAQRQQVMPSRRSESLSHTDTTVRSSPTPPASFTHSNQFSEPLATAGRVTTTGSSSRNVGDSREREDMLRRGQQETQQAISVGQAHIVICQGCNGRLHAPLSYSLVFCPNCHTISPGLPVQSDSSR